jgi:hypothetical protein
MASGAMSVSLMKPSLSCSFFGTLAGGRGIHRERQRGDNGCDESPEHYMRHF